MPATMLAPLPCPATGADADRVDGATWANSAPGLNTLHALAEAGVKIAQRIVAERHELEIGKVATLLHERFDRDLCCHLPRGVRMPLYTRAARIAVARVATAPDTPDDVLPWPDREPSLAPKQREHRARCFGLDLERLARARSAEGADLAATDEYATAFVAHAFSEVEAA